MKVMSIDNVYEEDGLVNLLGFLSGLNRQEVTDPLREILVAVLPEYDEATGRLDRLDCVTVQANDTGPISEGLKLLSDGKWEIVAELQEKRREALEKLDESVITVVKPELTKDVKS